MMCSKNPYQELIRNIFIQLENKLIGEELWILAAFMGLVILSVFTWLIDKKQVGQKKNKWGSLLFFALVVIVVLIGQTPNLGRYAVHINETQHIAEARTLVSSPLFWKDVDGTTIGPIPIYSLSLLGCFNIPIDYFTSKVLNTAFWLVIIILLYSMIKFKLGFKISRFSILPLVVFVALFSDKDFVVFNGEVPTLVLESLGLWILFYLLKNGGKNILLNLLLGFLLVLMPFSKIQVGPVAVFMGLFYLIWLMRNNVGIKPIAFLLTGVSIPIIILIVYLIHFDIWHDFKESYILNNLLYAGKGEGLSHNKGIILNFVKFIFILFRGIELRLFFLVFMLICFYTGFIVWKEKRYEKWHRIIFGNSLRVFLFGFILTSAFIVYLPGNVFLHYALFLIPPVLLIMGFLLRTIIYKGEQKGFGLFYLIICVIGPSLIITFQGHPFFSEINQKECNEKKEMAAFLCSEKEQGDKLALWGWESSLYSDTGLMMATRESQTQRQILSWKQKDYYMKRYIEDFKKSKPRYFVDSTLKNNWIFRYKVHNYTNYPELYEYIDDNYLFVAELDKMKLFERRDN